MCTKSLPALHRRAVEPPNAESRRHLQAVASPLEALDLSRPDDAKRSRRAAEEVNRQPLDVVDIFHAAGREFMDKSSRRLTWQHLKVLRAIEHCRLSQTTRGRPHRKRQAGPLDNQRALAVRQRDPPGIGTTLLGQALRTAEWSATENASLIAALIDECVRAMVVLSIRGSGHSLLHICEAFGDLALRYALEPDDVDRNAGDPYAPV